MRAKILFINVICIILNLSSAQNATLVRNWVFFADKGNNEKGDITALAARNLSLRALERRRRLNIPLDIKDIPVPENYVAAVESLGAKVIHKSRWLNAVSVLCDESTIEKLLALPFVKSVEPVKALRSKYPSPIKGNWRITGGGIYGAAKQQNEIVGADRMHQAGYHGEGVLIGMLDSGFDIDQPAFDSLIAQNRIVAKYDFVHNDTSVGYDTLAGDFDIHGYWHGTMTLSCIGANLPETMVGVAPSASFALGKTEITDSLGHAYERNIEEDNWVAGAEWLDSLGADIISSSLGYYTFDSGENSYTFDQLNGDIAIVTNAADIAASKGIAVINSAGNERGSEWGHIITPADGDSVCAVGATTFDGWFASFSSPGPTADGRTKPDLSAPGYMVAVWNPDIAGVYLGSGTSFSCPITAGTAALVLQALRSDSSEIGGWDLIETMKNTADQADEPDNDFGWGIPKAPVAANISDAIFAKITDLKTGQIIEDATVIVNAETLYSDKRGIICAYIPKSDTIYEISAKYIGYFKYTEEIFHRAGQIHRLKIALETVVQMDRELLCYPNPFDDSLTIVWTSNGDDVNPTIVHIFNAAGEIVREIKSENGRHFVLWDGKNRGGNYVADGVYIVVADISNGDGSSKTRRIKALKIR